MFSEQEVGVLQELLQNSPPLFETDSSSLSSTTSDTSDSSEHRRRKKVRIENYVENIVNNYDEQEFKSHFRMKRATVYMLIERLKNSDMMPVHKDGREKITPEKAFLITLWYLGNMETFRQIADRFNCTESSVHRMLKRVIEFLFSIRQEIIKWPLPDEADRIANILKDIKGIGNVIGLIDGSHIEIPRPKENQEAYCNRKGYHSLLLQGIVDDKKKFIDVFCGEPGSMNDARLLRKSGIFRKIVEEPAFIGNYFLLGDSAYPNLHWLVTPFTDNGNLSRDQRLFNYYHSATRILVENAFGLLKTRFRRLKKLDNTDLLFCSHLIMASCILHNICIDYVDIIDHDDIDYNQPEQTYSAVFMEGNSRQIEVFEKLLKS